MWRLFLIAAALIASLPTPAQGEAVDGAPLKVVLADCPPFVM
jgi:hypothetical protein